VVPPVGVGEDHPPPQHRQLPCAAATVGDPEIVAACPPRVAFGMISSSTFWTTGIALPRIGDGVFEQIGLNHGGAA